MTNTLSDSNIFFLLEPVTNVPPWSKKKVAEPEVTAPVYHAPAPPQPQPPAPAPAAKTEEEKTNEKNAMASESWPPSLQ